MAKDEMTVPSSLRGIVKIKYLRGDNCTLFEKNGFLGVSFTDADAAAELSGGTLAGTDTESERPEGRSAGVKISEDGTVVSERIYLARAFPLDMPDEYISVLDRDKREIAFIRSLDDFGEPERSMLRRELDTKYYTPEIKRIISVKERYGFSFWKTECEFGEKSFTLQDTFRSIIKNRSSDGTLSVCVLDIDGNRYGIPDVESLDRRSYKKIELYL